MSDVDLKNEGNKLMQANQYQDAVDKYSAAIALNDKVAIYYGNRSQAHIKLENWGSAIEDASKAVELDSSYAKGYHRRAVAKLGLGHYKEALPDLKRVCMLQPQDRSARSKLSEVGALVKRMAFEAAIVFEQRSVFEEIAPERMQVD